MSNIREQMADAEEFSRRLRAAERAVYESVPAPSTVPPAERLAARERMIEALEEARRRVSEEFAAERAPRAAERAAARQAAEAAEADRFRAEREAAEAAEREVPPEVADALTADAEVADLERRIAAGDESVSVEQLAAAREGAEGRRRFARLRQVADERRQRREAEAAEAERVERARAAAREALAPYAPAILAERYDRAVAAVADLVEVCDGRMRTIAYLARQTGEDRLPDAVPAFSYPMGTAAVVLDGVALRAGETEPAEVLRHALGNAGVAVGESKRRSGPVVEVTDRAKLREKVPGVVARGREGRDEAGRPKRKRAG